MDDLYPEPFDPGTLRPFVDSDIPRVRIFPRDVVRMDQPSFVTLKKSEWIELDKAVMENYYLCLAIRQGRASRVPKRTLWWRIKTWFRYNVLGGYKSDGEQR